MKLVVFGLTVTDGNGGTLQDYRGAPAMLAAHGMGGETSKVVNA
jgi:hypothetical protein